MKSRGQWYNTSKTTFFLKGFQESKLEFLTDRIDIIKFFPGEKFHLFLFLLSVGHSVFVYLNIFLAVGTAHVPVGCCFEKYRILQSEAFNNGIRTKVENGTDLIGNITVGQADP